MHTVENWEGEEVETHFANYEEASKREDEILDSLPTEVAEAVRVIISYGGIDGAHHKNWCLDQVLRNLLKDEKVYKELIDASCWHKSEGPWAYSHDEGIAP